MKLLNRLVLLLISFLLCSFFSSCRNNLALIHSEKPIFQLTKYCYQTPIWNDSVEIMEPEIHAEFEVLNNTNQLIVLFSYKFKKEDFIVPTSVNYGNNGVAFFDYSPNKRDTILSGSKKSFTIKISVNNIKDSVGVNFKYLIVYKDSIVENYFTLIFKDLIICR